MGHKAPTCGGNLAPPDSGLTCTCRTRRAGTPEARPCVWHRQYRRAKRDKTGGLALTNRGVPVPQLGTPQGYAREGQCGADLGTGMQCTCSPGHAGVHQGRYPLDVEASEAIAARHRKGAR